MTLEQKIGQMMMVGWQSDKAVDIIESIKRYNFGNVILFTRNIKSAGQIRDVCGKIQEIAKEYNGAPCFIGIDQEGGSVRRIYEGVTAVPGSMAVASASVKYPNAAGMMGKIVGSELKSLGINFNIAPCVDVNTNPNNPVIAIRAFGDDPEQVTRLGSIYASNLQNEGVIACYKHFLGHGDVDVDSHLDLPRLNKTLTDLELCELVPYKNNLTADAVMTVHILYKALDDHFPASISKNILQGLLRGRLGYKGIIITDCFEMDGLIRTFSLEEAATFAVNASTDIVTVSHTFGRQLLVRNALISAVQSGVISEETINTALNRILKYKEKYCYSVPEKAPDFKANYEIANSISRAGIALISGKPFEIDSGTVVIGVTNYVNSIAEDTNVERMDIAKMIGDEFNIPHRSIDNKNFNLNETLGFVKNRKVILCLADSHLTLVQRVLYSSLLQNRKEVMLISLRTPYDIINQDPPHCHICTFEYTSQSCRSLIEVLRGGKTFGVCPVKLNKKGAASDTGNQLVDNVLIFIKNNYSKRLTLANVAEEFLISGGHLCKLLKKKINKGFSDCVNEVRIAEAKRLLCTTTLKVYEVSSLCGFNDIEYFANVFKKYNGVTPSFFRNNYRIND